MAPSEPIIDTHIHLWDYDLSRYPWLAGDGLEPLRRDHLPEDYWSVAGPCGVTASVHVEAGWREDEPRAETLWLYDLERPAGVADRLVAHIPLIREDAEALIAEQAAHDAVVGIRDILTWHPDPAKTRMPDNTRMDDPVWRRNFAALGRAGLSFDMMISPWQAENAYRLAMDHPATAIAINHCGSPFDRDAEGMAHWRQGLRRLAEAPNTRIKISDPVAYDPDWTEASLTDVVKACVDTFGPDRAMFGSDAPVAYLGISFSDWVDVFTAAIADLSESERAAVLHDTAARHYRLPLRST